ncbi:hypothetical protein A2W24_02145 [Microgenomates group bacterium RBG_16_45_19]|nr:MAG: hypothetical protein A2W24_02145 [Microgenomates group bacterium RBG_16_45_19]
MDSFDQTLLDDPTRLAAIDTSQVLASIVALPEQCLDAAAQIQNLNFPDPYRSVKRVLIAGMGGSNLGGRIIEAVFADELTLPMVRLHDYHLPAWADAQTLIICSSYSGTTEETLSVAAEAIQRQLLWTAIGTGADLIALAQAQAVPYYQIQPTHNPSDQPRLALGYSLIGQLLILAKLGLINLPASAIDHLVAAMKLVVSQNQLSVPLNSNPAKQLAVSLYGRLPVLISSGHLIGTTHSLKNQFNENAKTFAACFDLPELNHHLMEGLVHPSTNPQNLAFISFLSSLYSERISRRFSLTQEVITQNHLPVYPYAVPGDTELTQAFTGLQFGSFVIFYLGMLYQQDPAPIPWVDYFKAKLA